MNNEARTNTLIKLFDFPKHQVLIGDKGNRKVVSKDGSFHLLFDYATGLTLKYGHTPEEDPTHCPFGPEIADIEITTKCPGIRREEGRGQKRLTEKLVLLTADIHRCRY